MQTRRVRTFQRVAHKAFGLARTAVTSPVGFLTYVIRQGVDYERYRSAGRRGLEGVIDAAIEERLRVFLESPPKRLLTSKSLDEICGPAGTILAVPTLGEADGSELPEPEQLALTRIVCGVRPKTMFEIGTYRGRTTRLLAGCAQLSTVHTLDLPPEDMVEGGCFHEVNSDLIGLAFREDARTRSRIVQHYGDSRQFNFAPFRRQMDLVFVDASHAYEAVLTDSRHALEMVTNDGVVVWDDYHPVHGPGVMRALAELTTERPLLWIKGTRLAISGLLGRGQ